MKQGIGMPCSTPVLTVLRHDSYTQTGNRLTSIWLESPVTNRQDDVETGNDHMVSFLSQYNARGNNQTWVETTCWVLHDCINRWYLFFVFFPVSFSMGVLQIGRFLIPDSPAQLHWRKGPAASSAAQHPGRTPLWFYPGRRWLERMGGWVGGGG